MPPIPDSEKIISLIRSLPDVVVIGRWKTGRLTGVQRFAHEVDLLLGRSFNLIYTEHTHSGVRRLALFISMQLKTLLRPEQIAYGPCNLGVILKKRQLIIIHDTAIFDFPESYKFSFILYYRFMFFLTIPFARAIGTVSEFSKSRIEHHFPSARGKVRVVGNGVAPFWFSKSPQPHQKYLLVVSSLDPKKNFAALVDAWLSLIDDHPETVASWKVKIVGDADGKIFRSGVAIRKHESIEWLGRVSDEELKNLYSVAGGFFFPSKYEGFGLPPLEAMAAGAVVAMSSAASLPEVGGPQYDALSSPEGCCFYFSPDDIADIRTAILNVVNLPQSDRERIRINAVNNAAAFTWDKVGARVAEIIGSL